MHTNKKIFTILFIMAILVVGIVYSILPHSFRYYILSKTGERYIAITQESNFDHMNVQAGRYREILDGKVLSAEVDTYEHRDDPSLWPILSAAVLAPLLFLTKSVFATFIISDFVFPVLIFIAFYLLINVLTKNSFFALACSFVLMMFPQLPVLIPPSSFTELRILFLQFFPIPIGVQTMRLNYLTRESFIPSGPFFIFSFFFAYKAVSQETKKGLFIILAGVFYGLLFYLYLYFWVFTTIFLGLFFVVLLLSKRKAQALSILMVGLIGFIVSIPFWISHNTIASMPNYWDMIANQSLEIGHGVKWFLWKTYSLYVFMAALAFWLGKKLKCGMKEPWTLFLISMALAGIVAYNVNVVTGYFVQSDHWGNKVFLVTTGIIWAVLISYLIDYLRLNFKLDQFKKFFMLAAALLCLSLLTNVIFSQITTAKKEANNYTVPENLMRSYEWLNNNTPVGSVVMSPSLETNIDLSVYSHNRIFLARSQSTAATQEEVLNRLNIAYALLGVNAEYLSKMIQSHRGVFYFFTAKFNSTELDASLRSWKYSTYKIPDIFLNEILDNYNNFEVPSQLPYKLDYIFIGPKEKEIGINDKILDGLDKLYDYGGIQIYRWKE